MSIFVRAEMFSFWMKTHTRFGFWTSGMHYNNRSMKKTYFIGAMLFATLLFACTSGDDKVAKTPEEPVVPEEPVTPEDPADPETPEDPVIVVTPSGFDWTTDRRVDLTLESPVRTRVSVYYDEACREASLVGEEILLEAGVAEVIPAAVPSDTETLYVKYPAASGETAVVAIALNAAADDTAAADYKFPDDAVRTTYEKDGGFQFWHNSGVVMVEDMWPDFASSDADFNDLVMEYDLKFRSVPIPRCVLRRATRRDFSSRSTSAAWAAAVRRKPGSSF